MKTRLLIMLGFVSTILVILFLLLIAIFGHCDYSPFCESTVEPLFHYSQFDGEIIVENRCTENLTCYGNFDNGTKIILDCNDMVIHGCSPKSFDNYVGVENEK